MNTPSSSSAMRSFARRYHFASHATTVDLVAHIQHHPDEFLEAMKDDGLLSTLAIVRDPGFSGDSTFAMSEGTYYRAITPPPPPPPPHKHQWVRTNVTIPDDLLFGPIGLSWCCMSCPAKGSETITGPRSDVQ